MKVAVLSAIAGLSSYVVDKLKDNKMEEIEVSNYDPKGEATVEETVQKIIQHEILITDPVTLVPYWEQLVLSSSSSSSKLKWVKSTRAGVDCLMGQKDSEGKPLPKPSFQMSRMGNVFGEPMAEYVMGVLLNHERQMHVWKEQQRKSVWRGEGLTNPKYRLFSSLNVGIMGCSGGIGAHVAKVLKTTFNCNIVGLCSSVPCSSPPPPWKQHVDQVFSSSIDGQLDLFLQDCDYVVNILPSTPKTKGLLSGEALKNCLKRKAVIINVGRGDIFDEESMVRALDNQWIGGLILDVFLKEPLPKESKLWQREEVFITPHVSALNFAPEVFSVFLSNLKLYQEKKPLSYSVDFDKGY